MQGDCPGYAGLYLWHLCAIGWVIVVGTIRLIGSNANNVFSQVGSAIQ